MSLTLLMTTWRDGLLVLSDQGLRQEFPGQPACGLTRDGRGGALVIVEGRMLYRRMADERWRAIASSPVDLSCCVEVGDAIYAGTDDARVLCIDASGRCNSLDGFDAVDGRDKWYAGAALVDGKLIGPPLGIRSMAATCDGSVLLANVHVGGIPRSVDGGKTWRPTIDIDVDVHQVCTHPTRADLVAAAAAVGLCISRDGGATWAIDREGLHARYCSAVAFVGDDIFVAASADHFAPQGAIYRRPIDGAGPLEPVGGGLPRWTSGICDTGGIATRNEAVVIADQSGNVYQSTNLGRTWSHHATGRQYPTGLVIL
jgi:photosystem II stability/assembly factor-like uncharacterized protein